MDFLMTVGSVIATAVFGLIGWVLKMIFGTLKEHRENYDLLEERLSAHKLHAAEVFATKLDVEKGFDRIMTVLHKIDGKLDTKADKP